MNEKSSKEIDFIIDSRFENVCLIGMAIRELCSLVPLKSAEAFKIELGVVEAVNNTIEHSYINKSRSKILVRFSLTQEMLIVEIQDRGKTMDFRGPPSLNFDPEKRESLPEGGVGRFIIHQIMDEVNYQTKDRKNILTLIKHIKS